MYYCKKIKGCHHDVHIWTNFAFLMYISELVFLIIPFIFTNVTTRDGYNWSKQGLQPTYPKENKSLIIILA
jgi:hypothetical protein